MRQLNAETDITQEDNKRERCCHGLRAKREVTLTLVNLKNSENSKLMCVGFVKRLTCDILVSTLMH